ncbi:hypothetical protein GGTG_08323 [Gaeumannomyces tritici R3-111a-1]|uniref:Uncharacterized protein n=1 Tax=Gaeumannomyces tritici (strain R3-111a-1) TaxID=644352 RepID=J3P487_GAET3|nr:hypothetical protein GGTG_08323 [Gaeumannomyces tritici R3-111a-1]EJT74483.1 hypothetical protein GGTG_08323 [Gaeumannomyces tritici R3-111a-1]
MASTRVPWNWASDYSSRPVVLSITWRASLASRSCGLTSSVGAAADSIVFYSLWISSGRGEELVEVFRVWTVYNNMFVFERPMWHFRHDPSWYSLGLAVLGFAGRFRSGWHGGSPQPILPPRSLAEHLPSRRPLKYQTSMAGQCRDGLGSLNRARRPLPATGSRSSAPTDDFATTPTTKKDGSLTGPRYYNR